MALRALNQRIRYYGLSSKEILLQREHNTGKQLNIDDQALVQQQREYREANHLPSAAAKAKELRLAENFQANVGDLVYIKPEGSKFSSRPMYIVTGLADNKASLQKLSGNLFSSL